MSDSTALRAFARMVAHVLLSGFVRPDVDVHGMSLRNGCGDMMFKVSVAERVKDQFTAGRGQPRTEFMRGLWGRGYDDSTSVDAIVLMLMTLGKEDFFHEGFFYYVLEFGKYEPMTDVFGAQVLDVLGITQETFDAVVSDSPEWNRAWEAAILEIEGPLT